MNATWIFYCVEMLSSALKKAARPLDVFLTEKEMNARLLSIKGNRWRTEVWQKGGYDMWYCIYLRVGPLVLIKKGMLQ